MTVLTAFVIVAAAGGCERIARRGSGIEPSTAKIHLLESRDLIDRNESAEALARLASALDHLEDEDRNESLDLLRSWGAMGIDFQTVYRQAGSPLVFNWNERAYLRTGSGELRNIGDTPIDQLVLSDDSTQVLVLSDAYTLRLMNVADASRLAAVALDNVIEGESLRVIHLAFDSAKKEFVIDAYKEASYAGGDSQYRIRLASRPPYGIVSRSEGDSSVATVSAENVFYLEFPKLRDEVTAWTPSMGASDRDTLRSPGGWLLPDTAHSNALERELDGFVKSLSKLPQGAPGKAHMKAAVGWLENSGGGLAHLDYRHGDFRYVVFLRASGAQHGVWTILKLDKANRLIDWSAFEVAGDAAPLRVRGRFAYMPDFRMMGADPFILVDLDSLASFKIDSVPDGWGPSIPALSRSERRLAIVTSNRSNDEGMSGQVWIYSVDAKRHRLALSKRTAVPANAFGSTVAHLTNNGILVLSDAGGKLTAVDVQSEQELWQRQFNSAPADDRTIQVATDGTDRFMAVFGRRWIQMISIRSGVAETSLFDLSTLETTLGMKSSGVIRSVVIDSVGAVVIATDSAVFQRMPPLNIAQLDSLLARIETVTGRPRERPYQRAALPRSVK
jgi:hypothetical protein